LSPVGREGLLPRVAKPARYLGEEHNAVHKDHSSVAVTFALAFPDVYEVGMSHLGLRLLYDILNQRSDTACERVFTPWPDMGALMRESGTPLWALESGKDAAGFDIIGFSLQHELNFTNVLHTLDLAGIPLRHDQRGAEHPLIVGGGPAAFNPEPLADFFDLIIVGDGELTVGQLVDMFIACGGDKGELLRRAAAADAPDGFYVPSAFRPHYHDDGRVRAIEALAGRQRVRKSLVCDLSAVGVPERPIVPFLDVVHDRVTLEVCRGCTRGCRFCQAGMIYRPTRERSQEEVVEAARQLMANTGYDELSLLSLSTTDHSQIVPMVQQLTSTFDNLKVSLPSTRVDTFSVEVANAVAKGKKHTLTLAPEAGSQRLRNAINKLVSEDDLLGAAENAFQRGWTGVKMYYMVGLPTETIEDVEGIVEMGKKVKAIGRKHVGGRAKVRVSTSNLVPKPHTPFQWARQDTADELIPKHYLLKDGCRSNGVEFSWNDPKDSFVEAVLSRGDRRVANSVHEAWRRGAKFDAWSEFFSYQRWQDAFAATGVDAEWFAHREWDTREPLPWDHIDCGVTKSYLRGQWRDVHTVKTVADCHHGGCNVCGMQNFDALNGSKGVLDCEVKLEKLVELRRGSRKYEGEALELV
jgi:radical SAM family uncharacterized protein